MDTDDEVSVLRLLAETGLAELAEREQIILSFPNPIGKHWKAGVSKEADDVRAFPVFQEAMSRPDDKPMERNANGIPTYEAMISTWHPMNDTKYLIAISFVLITCHL